MAEVMAGFDISAPAAAVEGFDGILYGNPKTGKTSTLDDPKMKVLLIDLEGGSAVLSEAENVRRIDVPEEARKRSISQFEVYAQIIKAVENGQISGFDLYATDSLTHFETMVKEFVATKFAPNRKREIVGKFGATADWGDLKDLIVSAVKRVHSLTKRGPKSIHHMWIAHVGKTKDEVTSQVTETKIQLQGSNTAEVVMSVVDGIFYMYNRSVTTETEGGKKDVQIERGILTKASGIYVAGVRQSKKRDPLPTVIKSPVWSDIFEKLGYVKK